MRIVSIASEVAPYAKTGGLADVAGALPDALAARGHDVHVILPLHGAVDRERHRVVYTGDLVDAWHGTGVEQFGVHRGVIKAGRALAWFLHHPSFDRPTIYGEEDDDAWRFTLFTRAALELTARFGGVDVIHVHDWQTAIAAADLRAPGLGRPEKLLKSSVVHTIHNLAYTGSCGEFMLAPLGIPRAIYDSGALEFHGRASLLKAGLVYADALTAVSPRYAREICTREFGHGLDELLVEREPDLQGILNGIDGHEWTPATDRHLPATFDAAHMDGKGECKRALQHELGLHVDYRPPIFGVVSRMVWQKGLDLVADNADRLVEAGAQLVVLGSGEHDLEARFIELSRRYPGRVAVRIGYNDGLSHRIIAGSDLLFMPSRFEPCGLAQLYAMAYGTIPIVRAVGGLDDTVEELDGVHGTGTGFKFGGADQWALWAATERALDAVKIPEVWSALKYRAMQRDFSWNASAAAYEQLFENLRAKGRT